MPDFGQPPQRILFCIPILDDWDSAALLLERLGRVASEREWVAEVLFVDDGSVEPWSGVLTGLPEGVAGVDVLELRRNVGHQRAIAVGLAHISDTRPADVVVVMDGDGEDMPESVPDLVARASEAGGRGVVFARRLRRSETWWFRLMYHSFRVFHRVVVGRKVEVGNFSAIPRPALDRLMGVPEIASHYAAGVEKARIPMIKVPLPRGRRLSGEGKMSFVSLVTHGLAAMSVWGEEIGVRLLIASVLLVLACLLGVAAVTFGGVAGYGTVPPWALQGAALLGVMALIGVALSALFSFVALRARNLHAFVPLRDYRTYVARSSSVGPPST